MRIAAGMTMAMLHRRPGERGNRAMRASPSGAKSSGIESVAANSVAALADAATPTTRCRSVSPDAASTKSNASTTASTSPTKTWSLEVLRRARHVRADHEPDEREAESRDGALNDDEYRRASGHAPRAYRSKLLASPR